VIPEQGTLALFAVAALALVIVPGPAVLYVVAQSVEHGRRAGVVSALGIQTGGLVHVLAAAIGLSSLLVSSALASRS
jgi:threonine/homoserine/homoserine lactone efflux protein